MVKTESPRMLVAAVETVAEGRTFLSDTKAHPAVIRSTVLPAALAAAAERPSSSASPRLTPRELEIVKLLAEGRTSKEVAQVLGISAKTVDVHRTNTMRRLNFHSVSELVRYAIREHIIEP